MSDLDSLNCTAPFTRQAFAIVAGLSAVSAFISLVACCFIVFLIVLFKKWRYFSQHLVFYLAVAVILESVGVIIHRIDYNNERSAFYVGFCKFSAFVEHTTSWMEFNSIIAITVYIFVCAVFRRRTDRGEWVYVFFIFIFPILVFGWIPFTVNAFGRAGAWCWIISEDIFTCEDYLPGQVLQFVLWYIPLYVGLVILLCMYTIIIVKINCYDKRRWNRRYDDAVYMKLNKEIRSLLVYPLIYFIINVFLLINRIYGITPYSENPSLALWFLSGLTFPLKGGIIALAFTLDRNTRKRLKPAFFKAALKDLFCKSEKKRVMEYPIEHIAVSTSVEVTSTMEDNDHKTVYKIADAKENTFNFVD